jgi:hypothetical protein
MIIKGNLPEKYHKKIIMGIGVYNQEPRSSGRKIYQVSKNNLSGISIFSYTVFKEKPNYAKKNNRLFKMKQKKIKIELPAGTKLTCKNWQIEAAYRMIQHNLNADVAEHPEDLIVYGGKGKAARNWEAYYSILETLERLNIDETLLVQSGKPVGVVKTHTHAPRVLIAKF